MPLLKTYLRVISYLKYESATTTYICIANIILSLITIAEPILFGKIIYAISHKQNHVVLTKTISIWVAFGIFNIISYVLVARSADQLAHKRRLSVMVNTYSKILSMPAYWYKNYGSSNPLHIMLRACDAMSSIWLEFMRQHLSTIISLIILIPTALSLDIRLSSVLLALSLTYVMVNRLVMNKTKNGQKSIEKNYHNVFSHITDTMSNVTLVQNYNRIELESAALSKYADNLLQAQLPILNWWALASGLNRMASTLSMVVVLSIGSLLVIKGQLNIGDIIAFVGFAQIMIARLDQISGFINLAVGSRAILEEFFNMVDSTNNVVQNINHFQSALKVKGKISFHNVSFKYKDTNQGIYDINFDIEAGQTVAIIGPTGAGKTTLIKLLQNMYPLNKGKISIDGIDINDIDIYTLRENIATVLQNDGLFNRTIEENIKVGDIKAEQSQIIKAAKQASANEFIIKKPQKYQTLVGECGSSLSGGEKQRLAIARAILKDAPILILDEATSALDVKTEEKIKQALDTISKNRTTIIIAHRLSTIKNADLILYIDNGKIIEKGRYTDLAKNKESNLSKLLKLANISTD